MELKDYTYCGLNCTSCQVKFTHIRLNLEELDDTFAKVYFGAVFKEIPFMSRNYKGYKKLSKFFMNECPGCRDGGDNPYCPIRMCY